MKTLAFIFMFTTLFTTVSYSSEVGDAAQAIIDARVDAENDVGRTQRIFTVCCFGIIGTSTSTTNQEIPIERFIGKSPEYIYFYTEEYYRKTQSLQANYAWLGWLSGAAVSALLYFALGQLD